MDLLIEALITVLSNPHAVEAFAPIVLAQALVPPLSRLREIEYHTYLERIFQLLPYQLQSQAFVESLCLPVDLNVPLLEWLLKYHRQAVSHIFVHADYDHLTRNLIGALYPASCVYNQFGSIGLFGLFLSGGIASAIPTPFLRMEHDYRAKRAIQASGIGDLIERSGTSQLATRLLKLLPFRQCGSSGAVYALSGSTLCLLVRGIMRFASEVYNEVVLLVQQRQAQRPPTRQWHQLGNGNNSRYAQSFERVVSAVGVHLQRAKIHAEDVAFALQISLRRDPNRLLEVVARAAKLLSICNFVLSDHTLIFERAGRQKQTELMSIARGAHMQGFAWGTIFTITGLIVQQRILGNDQFNLFD